MNLLTVTVNLEDVAGVKTLRSTLHDSKGQAFAMAVNVIDQIELRDMLVGEHLRAVAKHVVKNGVPNDVSVTTTTDVGTQGNRTPEVVSEDPARTA